MGSAIAPYRSPLIGRRPGRGMIGYLSSRRNLTGLALALVGAGLVVADPVGVQGVLLVAGLYLAGGLAAHGPGPGGRVRFDPPPRQETVAGQNAPVGAPAPPRNPWKRP